MTPTDLLLLLPVLLYLLGTLGGRDTGWLPASAAAVLALVASAAGALLAIWHPLQVSPWLAATPLNLVMSLLVSLIGFVVVRFSVAYLAGDPVVPRYRFWLQLCLASVSLVVISNHLLLLLLAWSAISICLHQLLVCYPDRFRAVLAAHKKFIFARLAEACLLGAALLLWQHHDSFIISNLLAGYAEGGSLAWQEHAAAVLLALAALIKCAQLPVHGWLMQVVEAPTPVSALLHAGIINLGGYLMILFAPLVNASAPARWLLLIVGGLTAVLAALIMLTRISIKVRLAWSTSSQMGLMLVECALGLHELALLHLLAHSCYKAHAFLGSGGAVLAHLDRQLVATRAKPKLQPRNLLLGLALIAVPLWLTGTLPSPAEWSIWLLILVAVSLWLPQRARPRALAAAVLTAGLILLAYLAQKSALTALLPPSPDAGWPEAIWTMGLIALLLGGHALLNLEHRALSYRWRQWLFAGLYLDEWVTRTTLKLWPVTLPVSHGRKPEQPSLARSERHEHLA